MEDFVTYEQAVKLKELGFDWPCYEFWDNSFCLDGTPAIIRQSKPKIWVMSECNSKLDKMGSSLITAPSLAKAAKWLREVHNIYVSVFIDNNEGIEANYIWDYELRDIKTGDYKGSEIGFFTSYEKALSAGIDAALKLIKE